MDGQLQETQPSTTEQKLQKEPLPGIVAIFVEPRSTIPIPMVCTPNINFVPLLQIAQVSAAVESPQDRKTGPPRRRQPSDREGRRRDVGRRLDALVARTVPGVRKAVKWNSPFYGVERQGEDQGWFLSFHCFTKYVKVAFFRGTSLRPVPPGESKSKDTRYLDIHEDDRLDEAQLTAWVKPASLLPGERM
jgi:hypothetical protein